MKVACVGNMNNMLFVLCRYLRDAGIDCDLLMYNNEMGHFLPENDSFDKEYKSYTKVLEWGDIASFDTVSAEKIRSDLDEYDFTIVTQAPAFFHKAGIKIDVFFPAGGDLFHTPFILDKMNWWSKLRQSNLVNYVKAHSAAIQSALVINQEPFSEPYRGALKKLKVDSIYYFGSPLVYQPMYIAEMVSIEYTRYSSTIDNIRASTDLMIVNQARQLWKSGTITGHPNKGSNHLIEGFAKFIKLTPRANAKLVLLEYGDDVGISKELIQKLAITEHVEWLPKMARKELMYAISIADIGCGEFDPGCIGGLTSWESLAVGTCLFHYMSDDVKMSDQFTGRYPFVNVRYSEEIFEAIKSYTENPKKYKEVGESGAEWYHLNFGVNCTQKWKDLILEKSQKGVQGLKSFIQDKKYSLSA